eukprot:2724770-Alexandrium_andersonii.AAC.1
MRALAPPPLLARGLRRATGRPDGPALFSTHRIGAGGRKRGSARLVCGSLPHLAIERRREVALHVELVRVTRGQVDGPTG